MTEARLTPLPDGGLAPDGDGWFVLNAKDAAWLDGALGKYSGWEGGSFRFPQFGINLNVMAPGEPMTMYHRENAQEDFLVLSGECLLLVEEQERPLKAWDFVHCPGGTEHVFVGAGDGPCVILMVGARRPDDEIVYPVSELAQKHGAGVETEAHDPRDAYADLVPPRHERLPDWGLPWQ